MNFKLTDNKFNNFGIYSNGKINAIANGNLFKGHNASVVKRALYVCDSGEYKGLHFIVPLGAKLVGGTFVEFINIER